MPIENRFALVTVRIPLSRFTNDDEMNLWPPGDWPQVIADGARNYLEQHEWEVVNSQMEGEVYRQTKFTFYCVWNVMGSMIAQYLEFENDPPTVKEIQAQVNEIAAAVMKTFEAQGQPLEEPPTDIVLFYFNRVGGKVDDAIPEDQNGPESAAAGRNEVESKRPNRNLRPRQRGNDKLN